MFEEDIEKLIERIVALTEDRAKYKGKIWTNAKGEASVEARILGDSIEEVTLGQNLMIKGLMDVCVKNGVPIAGVTNK